MTTITPLTIATRWKMMLASRSLAMAANASLLLACAAASPAPSATPARSTPAPAASTATPGNQDAPPAKGETVSDIGDSSWYVFQDKSDNYWFGTDGNGVCRYDGKTITRFTTKHGLSHDQVRGIQQHASTGDILITTNAGVSKFDGHRFVTLPITEMKPPSSADRLDEGPSQGWLLHADDLWLTGAGGPRRYDGKTLYQLKFPKSPLEEELTARIAHRDNWSPYDVWTVYADRKGHMWFGTGMFGICRFDGRSLDWMFEPHLTEVEGGGWFGFRSIICAV